MRLNADSFGYIFMSDGITSSTLTQLAREATDFSEIAQNNGHAVQGHSRSPILVPVEQWKVRMRLPITV